MMASNIALLSLSLAELATLCRQENDRYLQQRSFNPDYGYELFRRAIVNRNGRAWELIYNQYALVVRGWVERNPGFSATNEEADYFVNRAFEEMWRALTPDKFEKFPDLKSLLRYLQLCAHRGIIDLARSTHAQERFSIPPTEASAVEIAVLDSEFRQELWQNIQRQLRTEKEYRLIYYRYILNMKPRDILSHYAQEFSSLNEIHRMTQYILARLRRDPELRLLTEPLPYEGEKSSPKTSPPGSPQNVSYPELLKQIQQETTSLENHAKTYAVARIKDHQADQPFYLDMLYVLQAGIQREVPADFKGVAISISTQEETAHFDIAVSAEDMEIQPAWIQPYAYRETGQPSLVNFNLKPVKPGRKQIRVEFYHRRHWLAKIEFDITVVEVSEPLSLMTK